MTRESQQGRPLGVYVHFPWCVAKCPYCDFFSIEGRSSGIPHEAYADAVIDELESRCAALEVSTLRSIYFGGGTPSLWDATQVQRIVEHVVRNFGAREKVEITIECNPSSFDRQKCAQWREAGITRLSLGVQSLHDESLRYLGRAHDAAAAMDALRAAIDSGVAAVGADVIFGLPGRCPADTVGELHRLPLADLAHISAYALTIEPNTPFGALARKGKLELAPDEAVTEAFVAVHETLVHSGFEHYEISNYARPQCRSTHNMGYWQGHDYLGLGVAAWGTVKLREPVQLGERNGVHVRYRNTTRIDRYLALASREQDSPWRLQPHGILAESEAIDDRIALTERIMLGLRTSEGVDFASLAREFDIDAWKASRSRTLDKLLGHGRIALEDSRLWIPFPMWYLADGTISQLI